MSKKYALFLTLLFCGFLGAAVAAQALTPDRTFSEMENRALAQRPALTGETLRSGKFMEDYERYITDQFPGRDGWTAAKASMERASGKRENNGVYFCGRDTLITRFEEPDSERLTNNINYVNRLVEKSPVPVVFALIPTQAKIWADKLPQGAPNYDQGEVMDRARQESAASFVDLTPVLTEHKDEDIFYRTDHHWTSLGAYYGYVGLSQALGYEPVPLEHYQKTTVSTEFYGTVFSSSGARWVRPDEMDTYVPEEGIAVASRTYDSVGNPVEEPRQLYDESFLDKKDKYSMFLGGQQALGVVKTGDPDKPKLLLIRDSYSDCLVPFLTAHFSEIHLMDPRYCKLSPQLYMAEQGIDQALVLYSVPNFCTDGNLMWIAR